MRFLLASISSLFFFQVFAQSPVANFTAIPLSVCAGAPVSFTSTSSANGGAAIVSYAWNFGDGVSASTQNPVHAFTNAGTYTITLVVTNSVGGVDSEVKPNYITVLPSPNVGFNVAGLGCTVPLILNFTNTSSSGANYTNSWTFGGGQPGTSTSANPQGINFNTAGNYAIQLTVTNTSNGCTSSLVDSVVVSNFQAGITSPINACV